MALRICSCPDENGRDVLAIDPMFLPWLMWDEERPKGQARVVCQIVSGPDGEFMLESNGSVMDSPLYWRRPWEKLVGFRMMPATDLYQSGFDKRVKQEFMNLSPFLRVLLPNDAMVIVADVADSYPAIPMHLNYAVATQAELIELHNTLYTRFIAWRGDLINTMCHGEFRLPPEEDTPENRELYGYRAIKMARAIGRFNRQQSFWGRNFGSDASYEAELVEELMKEVEQRVARSKRR